MDELQLPRDLVEFLESGQQFQYEPTTCEAGQVTLRSRESLSLRTFRGRTDDLSGVDLIAACTGDYEPEGLLIWFPQEARYGVWDPSHDYVMLFDPSTTWGDIVRSPARYINAQWEFEELDRAPVEVLGASDED